MIGRLLEAGYSGKVTKAPPLKNAEILAVCAAAREVFLSQPTLIELSPPVKIVGDVHGQVRGFSILFHNTSMGSDAALTRHHAIVCGLDSNVRDVWLPTSGKLSLLG